MTSLDFYNLSNEITNIYGTYIGYNGQSTELSDLRDRISDIAFEYKGKALNAAYDIAIIQNTKFSIITTNLQADTNLNATQISEISTLLSYQKLKFDTLLSNLEREKVESSRMSSNDIQLLSTPDNKDMISSAVDISTALNSINLANKNGNINVIANTLGFNMSDISSSVQNTLGKNLDSSNGIADSVLNQSKSLNTVFESASKSLSAVGSIFQGKSDSPCGSVTMPDLGGIGMPKIGGIQIPSIPTLGSMAGINLSNVSLNDIAETVSSAASGLKDAMAGGRDIPVSSEPLPFNPATAAKAISTSAAPSATSLQKATSTTFEELKNTIGKAGASAAANIAKKVLPSASAVLGSELDKLSSSLPKEIKDVLNKCGASVLRCSTKNLNSSLSNVLSAIQSGKGNSQSQRDCQDAASTMVGGAIDKIKDAVTTIGDIESEVNTGTISAATESIGELDSQISDLSYKISSLDTYIRSNEISNLSISLSTLCPEQAETFMNGVADCGSSTESVGSYISNLENGDVEISSNIAMLNSSTIYNSVTSIMKSRINSITGQNKITTGSTAEETIQVFNNIKIEASGAINAALMSESAVLSYMESIQEKAGFIVSELKNMNNRCNSSQRKTLIIESLNTNIRDCTTQDQLLSSLEAIEVGTAIHSGNNDTLVSALESVSNIDISSNASSISSSISNLNPTNPDSDILKVSHLRFAKYQLVNARKKAVVAKENAERKEQIRIDDEEKTNAPVLKTPIKLNPTIVISKSKTGVTMKEIGFTGWDSNEREVQLNSLKVALIDYKINGSSIPIPETSTGSTIKVYNVFKESIEVLSNTVIEIAKIIDQKQVQTRIAKTIYDKSNNYLAIIKSNIKDDSFDGIYYSEISNMLDLLTSINAKAYAIKSKWPG